MESLHLTGPLAALASEPKLSAKLSKYVVTPYTCTKIAVASFVVGVFVGFRLKKSIRRMAEQLLKKLRDGD
ncbi:hypothetical protein MPTK1_3g11380 [Marchantia polymorpha subsp. ruderalis]|uniref:Uncharacterized protein n=2 Tax=Marchantia polymorpha TaxID=3197 RepID=A0AAF6AZP2_MARPO|nr:hypothetical protein MARPO_0037s0059 [Marchantia polymorpha]BBN05226.1 hypothetical protein Mp_3g11380 [Marchantia polymorpha subsp. ruderalis]|eukprot:PTQ40879.1 hypothetical protein MARPO_0037s0059 [Marchantia polymorpha]